jgi:hypothetical protein
VCWEACDGVFGGVCWWEGPVGGESASQVCDGADASGVPFDVVLRCRELGCAIDE